MLKRRLIPVVLMQHGDIVQSRLFKRYQRVGRPLTVVHRLADWASDELVFLDISRERTYDLGRDDLKDRNWSDRLDIIREMARFCAMPLTYGGQIRSLAEAEAILLAGADKISLNTLPVRRPESVTLMARAFGSQAIVISIDALLRTDGDYDVMVCGREPTSLDPVSWARQLQDLGAGEILLNAVHKDGTASGYDLELIHRVQQSVTIPVIALGGAGSWEDVAEVCSQTSVSAVAAANIFHHSENSVFCCKSHLCRNGHSFRSPSFQDTETRLA